MEDMPRGVYTRYSTMNQVNEDYTSFVEETLIVAFEQTTGVSISDLPSGFQTTMKRGMLHGYLSPHDAQSHETCALDMLNWFMVQHMIERGVYVEPEYEGEAT